MTDQAGASKLQDDVQAAANAEFAISVPSETGAALLALAPRLLRLENAVLKRASAEPLTFRQFRILRKVSAGITSLSAIGQTATVTLPAISESVDGLVRRGLLARDQEPEDLRIARLQLTPAGSAALDAAQDAVDRLGQELVEGFVDEDMLTVLPLLNSVIVRVTEHLARDPAS